MKLFADTAGSWIFVNKGQSTLDIVSSFDFGTNLWKSRV